MKITRNNRLKRLFFFYKFKQQYWLTYVGTAFLKVFYQVE